MILRNLSDHIAEDSYAVLLREAKIGIATKRDYKLRGKIIDKDTNEPVTGALVRVSVNKNNSLISIGHTVSGANGNYEFIMPREYINSDETIYVHAVKTENRKTS